MNAAIRHKFGIDIENGPILCVDHKTTLSGRDLGQPNFQILGPLSNFWRNWAIRFKFGTEIEYGPSCV